MRSLYPPPSLGTKGHSSHSLNACLVLKERGTGEASGTQVRALTTLYTEPQDRKT